MKTLSTLDGLADTNMTHGTHLKLEYLLRGSVFEILGCQCHQPSAESLDSVGQGGSTDLNVWLDKTAQFQISQWAKMNPAEAQATDPLASLRVGARSPHSVQGVSRAIV